MSDNDKGDSHADGSHGGGVRFLPPFVCVSDFRTMSQKLMRLRIAKLDTEMLHGESWKPIYSGV